MGIEAKVTQLMAKLTRETYSQTINWVVSTPPAGLVEGTNHIVPTFYSTAYKGKRIGVYVKRYRIYHDEDTYTWSECLGLCVYERDIILWEIEEYSPVLNSLFDAIKESASGIRDLLDDFLED